MDLHYFTGVGEDLVRAGRKKFFWKVLSQRKREVSKEKFEKGQVQNIVVAEESRPKKTVEKNNKEENKYCCCLSYWWSIVIAVESVPMSSPLEASFSIL